MKRKHWIIMILVVVLLVAWFAFCGYAWSWGPFASLHDLKTAALPGNGEEYGLDTVIPVEDSPLKGKTILFLGSSVTYGASAKGVSFADYLGAKTGCTVIKEAVSGTTLAGNERDTYVSRLEKLDLQQVDLVVVQLSTNDASQKLPLGSIDPNGTDFVRTTVAGAMETIISYTKEQWKCPVYFYTNSRYESENYAAMAELLPQLQQKWGIGIIDLWNDADFNNITVDQRKLYMADAIHPTQAGYLYWWLPKFEQALTELWEQHR